ncbi:MAG TPA: Ig-like domain-containing protein [Longimicrobiales bacterium]|nr:Ig-like domain-containing protein [Longimicrobiales bacterium]
MSTWKRIAVAAALALHGCGDGSTGPKPVASVDVSPAAVTLLAGQTTALAGVARDADGVALPDRELTWTSQNGMLATVSPAGAVTGLAEGSTGITATAEGVNGLATVTILPPAVASVEVEPAQLSLLPGETAQLTATALDAQGGTLTGRTFTWVSDDVSVATVDADGLVASVAPGSATIFATVGGRSGASSLGVDDPNAPRVLSVTPDEMVEGQPATLEGANFSAVVAENVVTIDGVRATVTSATDTSLDIVVPTLACRPRHLADVSVTVDARTGRSTHPARPAASFQLAEGQIALLQDPTAYCLQFDAGAADEEYLIGVQSTAYQPSTLTFAQVTSEKDATAPPATVGPRAAAPSSVLPRASLSDATTALALEWRAREAEVMRREVEQARLLPRAEPGAGPLRTALARIPGTVTVGTQVTVRYPDLESNNTCVNYIDVEGTVRHVGATGIWVSDDDNPSTEGYSDSDYTILGDQFEADIYPTQTGYFGAPDDADGNGRIVVVVTKEVNADGIGGIVPSANLFPRAQCPGSNEGEYFFMFAPDPDGEYEVGSVSALQARGIAPAILGHELVHNIHLSRRFALGLNFWDSWMHEGQATLGEEILGHALTGRGPGQDYGWTIIRDNASGLRWYYAAFSQLFRYYGWSGDGDPTISTDDGSVKQASAPEGCTWLDSPTGTNAGVCADRGLLVYGVSWAFLRWLTDHYSGSFASEAAMHTAWIDGVPGGFESIEALVGEDIEMLLARWAASLYMDDRVAGLDPFLTLPSWDLFDVESNVAPEARLEPRLRAFDDFSQAVQVRAGSTAYFLVSGADRPSTAIRVRAPSGGFLSPTMQLWVVRVR